MTYEAPDLDGELIVRIKLGNDAMRRPEDVARVFGEMTALIQSGWTEKKIADVNGNTVGSWVIE